MRPSSVVGDAMAASDLAPPTLGLHAFPLMDTGQSRVIITLPRMRPIAVHVRR